MRRRFRGVSVAAAVLVGALNPLTVRNSHARYFGRNKVRYEDFQFKVLNTPRFDIHYYPAESLAVNDAAHMLERWNDRLEKIFRVSLDKDHPIILYANHADFQQTNVISGLIPQGTGGVTEGLKSRIVIPLTGSYAENDHVLGHELVHAFQFRKAKGRGMGGLSRLPLWFIEGMAEYFSIGSQDPLTAMWMRDAVLHDDVPDFKKIGRDRRYFPYRYGHSILAYIGGTRGDSILPVLLDSVLTRGWQKGIKGALGTPVDTLGRQWRAAIKEKYGPDIKGRAKPSDIGAKIISGNGGINISPVISPDGAYLAFMSTRGTFTIDLFLADARTGNVIKKLTTSEKDDSFDALRFFHSAGAWSPDGKSFAFPVVIKGNNAISIMDITSRKVRRTVAIPGVDDVSHVSWSPDGHRLVISGTRGGISDLYLFDLSSGEVRQLTNDRHADLQPAWSPDGRSIAFATDRGESVNPDSLKWGHLKLGFYDMESGGIRVHSLGAPVKHINPRYSPDGKSVFFVADPDGYSDIYRLCLEGEEFFRITRAATGVSGITEISPVLSVSDSGRLVFSVFDKSGYTIRGIRADSTQGTSFTADPQSSLTTVTLPPVPRHPAAIVDAYLADTAKQSPADSFVTRPYDQGIGMVRVGQFFLSFNADKYGTTFSGAGSALFGDPLSNHNLMVAGSIDGSVKDIGGQVVYVNREKRWNWGVGAGHLPYILSQARISKDSVSVEGTVIPVERQTILRQRSYNEHLTLMTEYPLSANRRIELSAGLSHIHYDKQAQLLSGIRGFVPESRTIDTARASLELFRTGLAFTGDYSFFGTTSPLTGRRYRYEVESTVGSLKYVSLLADYRNYLFLRPLTFGIRAMHHGRYFGDAEDERLVALNIGAQTLVRGYGNTLVETSPQGSATTGDPQVDLLRGSRLAVINAEVRLPVLGPERLGLLTFPYLPTDLVAFVDGGVAWTKSDYPDMRFASGLSERVPIFSAGIGIRVNFLNILAFHGYYAYPFQQPDQGGRFGLTIGPGW